MTYLRPHNRERIRRNRVIATVIVIIAALVGAIQLIAPHVFPALFTAVARPFWRESFMLASGGLRAPNDILAENEALHRELAELKLGSASSSAALLESENRELLALLGRASTTPKQLSAAAVLAAPGFLPYDQIVIDLGEADGVSSTSAVYAPGRVLVGHVSDALAHSAKVVLYSSPRESYNVIIGPKHVPVTASGRGGGQYSAEVPHGSEIKVGDAVSDPSLYDRAFGVVISVITDPSNPFDTVLFAPPVNINELRFVLVETGRAAPVTSRR